MEVQCYKYSRFYLKLKQDIHSILIFDALKFTFICQEKDSWTNIRKDQIDLFQFTNNEMRNVRHNSFNYPTIIYNKFVYSIGYTELNGPVLVPAISPLDYSSSCPTYIWIYSTDGWKEAELQHSYKFSWLNVSYNHNLTA